MKLAAKIVYIRRQSCSESSYWKTTEFREKKMAISMREFHLATADEDTCRQWMRQHGLLAQVMTCPKCYTLMEEKLFTKVSDGKRWRCPPKNCRHTVSLRRGSFFEKSGKALTQLADLLYYWCIELSMQEVTAQVQVDENTVISWFNFIREICSADLIANPVQLGGPGHIVAIDETMVARRKPGNAQGRPVRSQWVFGGVDLNTGSFFMETVRRRDAATLTPVIQRNILPGTRIWSDEWRAYHQLPQLGYVHETVNHSHHFVNPATGVHTNNIEARWSACKATFKRRYGVTRRHLPSYLDEHMWRARRPHNGMAVFESIIRAIRVQYPV